VYPAHGAGSLCGKNMRAERSSTIGTERLTNYALQIKSRDAFVKELTTNLPARPEYFLQDAEINREGAPALAELPPLPPVSPQELQSMLAKGAIALDVRPGDEFAAAHVPGSINIALSGQFASWAGTLLGLRTQPVLIANSPEQLSEARMRLARVGIEGTRGYLEGGITAWQSAGLPVEALSQIAVEEMQRQVADGKLRVLDVRRESEWHAGHVAGAGWAPLDHFGARVPELDRNIPIAVHCKGGYRSMIACSFLQRAGYRNVINVKGGFDAWQQAQLPFVTEAPVEA
jgi:hydroxyacylglutathione hydrolase